MASEFFQKIVREAQDYVLTILLALLLIFSTLFSPLFTNKDIACQNSIFILGSPFNIRYEAGTTDGLIQNYFFLVLITFVFETFANLGKWKGKLLVFVFAVLASYATTIYLCYSTSNIGVGSSILTVSMAVMLLLGAYGQDAIYKLLSRKTKISVNTIKKTVVLLLLLIFVCGLLTASNAREHALGGFFFLALIFVAILFGFEIPFVKRNATNNLR